MIIKKIKLVLLALAVLFAVRANGEEVNTFKEGFKNGYRKTIVFATVTDSADKNLIEYGIVCGKNRLSEMTVGGKDTIKLKSNTERTSDGRFGIMINNRKKAFDFCYYVRAYGIYEKNKEKTIIYGDITEVVENTYPIDSFVCYAPALSEEFYPRLNMSYEDGAMPYTNFSVVTAYTLDETGIKGKPYISFYNAAKEPYHELNISSWGDNSPEKWNSFQIYKSCTVKVFATSPMDSFLTDGYKFTEKKGKEYIKLNNKDGSDSYMSYTAMYEKHYDVSKGDVKIVELPDAAWMGEDAWSYFAVVDFDDEEITPEIADIKFNENISSDFHDEVARLCDNFSDGAQTYLYNSVFHCYNICDELKGKPYIIMRNPYYLKDNIYFQNVYNAWGGKEISWFTFKINKSADIKIITDGNSMEYGSHGYKKTVSDSPYFVRKSESDSKNMIYKYEKRVTVKAGEYETVSIPNTAWFGNTLHPHIVVIDFL